MTLGEKLGYYRKTKNYTQDYVAESLGVTPQAVSKWENDLSCPDIMLLPLIADLYETTTDELLSRESIPVAAVVPKEKRKSIDDMIFHVHVKDGGDRVNINLPLALIKMFANSGMLSAININGGKGEMLSNIDWNALIALAENGVIGRLVEIEDSNGAIVVVEVV